MALALLASILPRIQQLLNRNRLAYATTGATGGNAQGAFRFDQEVVDATIHADGHVITEGYFQSKYALRKRFLVSSASLAHGAQLPEFAGIVGKAEWSTDAVTWQPSVEAGKDDIIEAVRSGASYVGAGSFAGQHYFDDEAGVILHSSPFFRFEYPSYTKTAALQCLEQHEPAIIAWTLAFLYKDNSNAPFDYYAKLGEQLLERVRAGSMRMQTYMPGPLPHEMRGR
jgi:hypothetical protein